jgi:hypothetical protein
LKPSKSDIINFWDWFSKNHAQLHSESIDMSALNNLDTIMANWNVSWEIGPGINTEYSLTISSNGIKELSDIVKEIIQLAPSIQDWEFFTFRQAKENWQTLKLPDQSIAIDASLWQYVLLQYPDDKMEILIKADNLSEFDEKTRNNAMELVLINLLGEESYLKKIDFFDLELNLEKEYSNSMTPIKYLPKHLNSLNSA